MHDNEERRDNVSEKIGTFVEGLDFYFEDGLMVLTKRYLLNRGYCCENDCRHCPYDTAEPAALQ